MRSLGRVGASVSYRQTCASQSSQSSCFAGSAGLTARNGKTLFAIMPGIPVRLPRCGKRLMSMALLDVQNLRKLYGQQVALEGVSLQVCQGEIFGLLGPNGAGKTTLLSIISCLLEATSGAVCLSGQKLSVSNRSLRRDIGIVPQELALYGELTARENLAFFGELYGLGGDPLRRRV